MADLTTTPPSAPPRKPTTTSTTISSLAALPARFDAFLAHLQRCLSTPSGIDTVLLLACYSSRLAAAALSSSASSSRRRPIAVLLPPRALVLLSSASTSSTTTKILALAKRLKALSELISEARTFLRLWALLGMYFWAKGLVRDALAAKKKRRGAAGQEKNNPTAAEEQNLTTTAIAWTQLLLCLAFQSLENLAFLSSKGVLGLSPAAQGRAYKWSARFWAAYVGVELGRLLGSKDVDRRARLARNLAWAPLTLHWSVDGGLVSELLVGLLGSVPGVIQMRALWRETAAQ